MRCRAGGHRAAWTGSVLVAFVLLAGCTAADPTADDAQVAATASAGGDGAGGASIDEESVGPEEESSASAPEVSAEPDAAAPDVSEPRDGTRTPTTSAPIPSPTEQDRQTSPGSSPEASAPPPTDDGSAPARSVEIVQPDPGSTVSAPVELRVAVSGFELEPIDGTVEEDRGHLYAFVDRDPPQERMVIPEADDIVRFAERTVVLPDLSPGTHTVTVVAAHGYPVPFEPRVQDQVTFEVG